MKQLKVESSSSTDRQENSDSTDGGFAATVSPLKQFRIGKAKFISISNNYISSGSGSHAIWTFVAPMLAIISVSVYAF